MEKIELPARIRGKTWEERMLRKLKVINNLFHAPSAGCSVFMGVRGDGTQTQGQGALNQGVGEQFILQLFTDSFD